MAATNLIKFRSRLNCERYCFLMPYVKDTLEINSMAFKYHWEQFVDQLSNWSTQAVNNSLRMGIMHRFPNLCLPETGISKAHKGGMKYCAEVIPYLPTTPECENVWRVRMTRLPSPLFRVFSSFVWVLCAPRATCI